ncbi:porin [Thiohalophilus sp.]|uniref:porin n=1 Tax=Thiohalophilus sp. TaxID=3028392 RepID=UPI002ACE1C10|nr:porin [Thiohalophilus sp.]MDZ7803927.1 porin [Thiohalophilus sp.]
MKITIRDGFVVLAIASAIYPAMSVADNSNYVSFPMAYMTLPDTSEPTANMHVLIEPTYRNSDSNNVYDLDNDFSFDRLRLGVYGSFSEKVDYFLTTEMAPNAITNETGGGAKAFIAHMTFKDVMGAANIAAGSMAVPMGHSFFVPSWESPWINYADIEYNLYGCGSINCYAEFDSGKNFYTNIWKPGVMVFDQVELSNGGSLTYTAGLYNTSGTEMTDNRVKQKDFNGSIEYHHGDFLFVYGTRIGASEDVTAWSSERDRTRHALTFMYNDFRKDKWWLWGEYMRGTDEQAAGVDDVTADGYFAALGFKFAPRWELMLRHSEFDRNVDVGGDDRQCRNFRNYLHWQ